LRESGCARNWYRFLVTVLTTLISAPREQCLKNREIDQPHALVRVTDKFNHQHVSYLFFQGRIALALNSFDFCGMHESITENNVPQLFRVYTRFMHAWSVEKDRIV
jgi:hypothetical protein